MFAPLLALLLGLAPQGIPLIDLDSGSTSTWLVNYSSFFSSGGGGGDPYWGTNTTRSSWTARLRWTIQSSYTRGDSTFWNLSAVTTIRSSHAAGYDNSQYALYGLPGTSRQLYALPGAAYRTCSDEAILFRPSKDGSLGWYKSFQANCDGNLLMLLEGPDSDTTDTTWAYKVTDSTTTMSPAPGVFMGGPISYVYRHHTGLVQFDREPYASYGISQHFLLVGHDSTVYRNIDTILVPNPREAILLHRPANASDTAFTEWLVVDRDIARRPDSVTRSTRIQRWVHKTAATADSSSWDLRLLRTTRTDDSSGTTFSNCADVATVTRYAATGKFTWSKPFKATCGAAFEPLLRLQASDTVLRGIDSCPTCSLAADVQEFKTTIRRTYPDPLDMRADVYHNNYGLDSSYQRLDGRTTTIRLMAIGVLGLRSYGDPEFFVKPSAVAPRTAAASDGIRLTGRDALRRWSASLPSDTRVELRGIDGSRRDVAGPLPSGIYRGTVRDHAGSRTLDLLIP